MKIESVTIQKFKRFENLKIEFRNRTTGEIANQFLVLGDNGTGKTTVLQSIALCLSLASGRIQNVGEFDWIGRVPGRYWRWGAPQIEVTLHFTDDEIEATQEAARLWHNVKGHRAHRTFIEPRVLIGIRDTSDDIANWLPEWRSLRNEIQQITLWQGGHWAMLPANLTSLCANGR